MPYICEPYDKLINKIQKGQIKEVDRFIRFPERHNLKELCDALAQSSTVTVLNFGSLSYYSSGYFKSFRIKDEDIKVIANIFKINQSIESLKLHNNHISQDSVKFLCQALLNNKTLKHLSLSRNHFGNSGFSHIAKTLQTNKSLTSINLMACSLGYEIANDIKGILHINNTINDIDLSANNIGDIGVQIIFTQLKHNKSLKLINLRRNNISDKGAIAIIDALKLNSNLIYINLTENMISEKYQNMIKQQLKRNLTILIQAHVRAAVISYFKNGDNISVKSIYDKMPSYSKYVMHSYKVKRFIHDYLYIEMLQHAIAAEDGVIGKLPTEILMQIGKTITEGRMFNRGWHDIGKINIAKSIKLTRKQNKLSL